MKVLAYIFLGISLFVAGVAVFFMYDDKAKKRAAKLKTLEKAREAKQMKSLLKDLPEPEPEPEPDIEELIKLIDDGSTKETK